jgi:hypothetical protein
MVAGHIARYGQHIVEVRPSVEDPPGATPFAYTIGNHGRGLPELLFVGSVEPPFLDLLNRLGEIQHGRGEGFRDGDLVDLGGRYPVRMVDAGRPGREAFAIQVGVYYGVSAFEVRQVVLCDPAGRFPEDPACEEPYRSQWVVSRRG